MGQVPFGQSQILNSQIPTFRGLGPSIQVQSMVPSPSVQITQNQVFGTQNSTVQPELERFKPGDNSKIYNPESGRWVGRGGDVYNSLISRRVIRRQ